MEHCPILLSIFLSIIEKIVNEHLSYARHCAMHYSCNPHNRLMHPVLFLPLKDKSTVIRISGLPTVTYLVSGRVRI